MVALHSGADRRRVDRPGSLPLLSAKVLAYLKSLSNAERASLTSATAVVVSRSTVLRVSNRVHKLRMSFLAIRSTIGLRHWKRAPGSKLTQFLHVCKSPWHFGH